jgi:hypothetical protein
MTGSEEDTPGEFSAAFRHLIERTAPTTHLIQPGSEPGATAPTQHLIPTEAPKLAPESPKEVKPEE